MRIDRREFLNETESNAGLAKLVASDFHADAQAGRGFSLTYAQQPLSDFYPQYATGQREYERHGVKSIMAKSDGECWISGPFVF